MSSEYQDEVAVRGGDVFPAPEQAVGATVSPEQLDTRNIVGFRSSDMRARPFKLLRSQVLKRCEDEGLKIIGISSAAPNVGKTFIASNLAAAISRIADLDVYLIDLDLHRPAIAPAFSLEDGPGIHDYLTGEEPAMRAIARRINDERLVVVPGFRRDVATGELLTSVRAEQMFEGLRALPSNTIVIVDMPPIFADDDAVIIGQQVDGFILVIEDGRTTAKQARETVRLLAPTPVIGSVLNRYQNQFFTDEYGYGLSYGYGGYY